MMGKAIPAECASRHRWAALAKRKETTLANLVAFFQFCISITEEWVSGRNRLPAKEVAIIGPEVRILPPPLKKKASLVGRVTPVQFSCF